METTIAVPNAIVFVLDPSNQHITVPDYIPGRITAANASCISVATLADVDGEVTLRLGQPLSDSETSGCSQAFNGSIETPGRKLAIVTSQFERMLEFEVTATVTHVMISVDDMHFPSIVCVSAV